MHEGRVTYSSTMFRPVSSFLKIHELVPKCLKDRRTDRDDNISLRFLLNYDSRLKETREKNLPL